MGAVSSAALVLAGVVVAAPTAGAIVVGLGAATTVANIAYKLLSAAVGRNIGLCRTSLLASDRFGLGRHPDAGLMRVRDSSFWYRVSEVDLAGGTGSGQPPPSAGLVVDARGSLAGSARRTIGSP